MKCLTCGSVSTGNFCNKCGRPLRCPSCGSYDLNKFCGNCGKLISCEAAATISADYKESFLSNIFKNQFLPFAVIALFIVGISYYFYGNSDETVDTIDNLLTSNQVKVASASEQLDPIYVNALSLIDNLKFEEALIELKKIPASSADFSKAQAKIDEIRFPLAQARLDRAKQLFEKQDYAKAYVTLQQAYGAITPPLQEAMDLAPIYEKASYAQSIGKELTEEDLAIPKKDYDFDDINARWTKSPEETDGYHWMEMTEKQKAYVISVIVFEWKKAGKEVTQDIPWYAQKLNTFYEDDTKGYSLTRALEAIEKEKDAGKEESPIN